MYKNFKFILYTIYCIFRQTIGNGEIKGVYSIHLREAKLNGKSASSKNEQTRRIEIFKRQSTESKMIHTYMWYVKQVLF